MNLAEKKKRIGNWLFVLLHLSGFVLLYFVIRDLEWSSFMHILSEFPAWKYAAGICILCMVYGIKALRWQLLNNSFGIAISWRDSLIFYLSAGFLSVITPGRLGEFAKVFFLHRKYGIDVGSATSSVVLDRIWDVLVLSFFAVVSVMMLIVSPELHWIPILMIALLFVISLFVILLPSVIFVPLLLLFSRFTVFYNKLENVYQVWKSRRFTHFFTSLTISALAFLMLAFIPILFSINTNYPVPYTSGLGAISISNILSFLPVTFAGFGTRELVFHEIWQVHGHAKEIAISVSTAYFMVTYLGSLLIGGVIYLIYLKQLYRPKEIRKVISA